MIDCAFAQVLKDQFHGPTHSNYTPLNRTRMKQLVHAALTMTLGLFLMASKANSQWTWQSSQNIGVGLQRVDGSLFLDATTGFIGGASQTVPTPDGQARIKKTTDGGLTWTSVFQSDSGSVHSFHFVNGTTGFAGLYGRVLRTVDTGATWQVVVTMLGTVTGVHFINEQEGFACGGVNKLVLHTTDGGNTWTDMNFPSATLPQLRGIHFSTPLIGYVISGSAASGGEGIISKTIDGGATWTQLSTGLPMEFFGFTFHGNTIFTYGRNGNDGRVIRSTDAGVTWTAAAMQLPTPSAIYDLVFSPDGLGMACTSDGKIYQSYTGGATWALNYSAPVMPVGMNSIAVGGDAAFGFGTSVYFVRNDNFVGVEEFEHDLAATLWPNPNDGHGFDVQLQGTPALLTTLQITDLQGRQVHTEQLSSAGQHHIGLASVLNPGVYQCAIISGASRWTARLLVQ